VAFVAANAKQAEDWNGASGREFIDQRDRHEQMLGGLRARLLAAAQIQVGEHILDIGCGCGDTTIPAARATPLVTVLDGHPHTLAFLATINRVPHAALGVVQFGQSGSIEDLYRYNGLDTDSIIRAALDLVDQ